MRPPLTDKEEKLLHFIVDSNQTRGYPPSLREIRDHLGYKSVSSVHALIDQLIQSGHIRKQENIPRAIQVIV